MTVQRGKHRTMIDARGVLAVSCWTLLVLLILGFLFSSDAVQSWVNQESTVSMIVVTAVLIVTFLAGMAAWISSLIHAWRQSSSYIAPRWLLVSVLLIGSFPASFFYYFLFVHWQRMPPEVSS